jgi:hypothetical protein
MAYLADGAPDAVIGVEENTLSPNPLDDFVAAHDLAVMLEQQNQDLQGDTLKPK